MLPPHNNTNLNKVKAGEIGANQKYTIKTVRN